MWEQLPLLTTGGLQRAYNVLFTEVNGGINIIWISADGPFESDGIEAPGAWTSLCRACGPDDGLVTPEGSLLVVAPAGPTSIDRLPAGGPWQYKVNGEDGGLDLFQTSLPGLRGPGGHGAIYSGGYYVTRSLDDGRPGSWEQLGPAGGEVVAFGEVPPSGALPAGRLLAGVYNGVSVSDDGGATWAPGSGAYGFARYIAHSFAFVPEPGHPYGGAVLAGVDDLATGRDSTATVYRSDDGGSTWARACRFSPSALGLENANEVQLLVTPDGTVWAGVTYAKGGLSRYRTGAIVRSGDGGRTWTLEQEGYGGHGFEALVAGPDGRVYAASTVGVWRTGAPVFAVAGEAGPGPAALALAVYPNPTAGRATVSLAAPGPVRLSVYDARGREVLAVHDGAARDGQRFAVDTEGLAPGAYVVRAAGASGAVSAGLTVAR